MADEIDIAQDRIEADIAHRIAMRTVYTGISATECECGEPIPLARQIAVPGAQLCMPCQKLRDLKSKGVSRL